MLDKRLYHHLVTRLGLWPAGQRVHVVGSLRRTQPAWDDRVYPAVGVAAPGGMVLSVPPVAVAEVRELATGPIDKLTEVLPAVVNQPGQHAVPLVFRYCLAPADLPDLGEWVAVTDPVVPAWLHPFGGEVLIVRDDDGGYLAGVGIKRHDRYGHELAVGTEPAGRGRGLARRLVAQAARRVIDEGAVPTYQHVLDNHASARVAEAAGFPDRGWRAYEIVQE
jgi:GNAT superfamily N-acetyltransferase